MSTVPKRLINTPEFSYHLRRRGIDVARRSVLITNFAGSMQSADFSLPANCAGFGRIHHFHRDQGAHWPSNPLPIDVAAHFFEEAPGESMQVQVFQNAICSWRCWYCFVDYDLLSGNPKHAELKTAAELLDLYDAELHAPRVIDLSGGQPDLVPEWSLWMADELSRRGKTDSVFLWSDDNLSNDYLWRHLSTQEVERLASYRNYARVGCFKGFDENSFTFNTNAEPELFLRQFDLMHRLVRCGFNVYGYVTLTSNERSSIRSRVSRFVDLLQEKISPSFPLRVIPLRIRQFSPTRFRMKKEHQEAMDIQQEAVDAFVYQLSTRFTDSERGRNIFEHRIV